jgi:hypothetical protein
MLKQSEKKEEGSERHRNGPLRQKRGEERPIDKDGGR